MTKEQLEKEKDTYVFTMILYSMSFKERIYIKMGIKTFPLYEISDKVKNMSEEELLKHENKLKKPWWDCLVTPAYYIYISKLLFKYRFKSIMQYIHNLFVKNKGKS